MEYREFYNGVKIPMLGFGVYQIPEYEAAKKAVLTALKTGYRLIDTAQSYMNENYGFRIFLMTEPSKQQNYPWSVLAWNILT